LESSRTPCVLSLFRLTHSVINSNVLIVYLFCFCIPFYTLITAAAALAESWMIGPVTADLLKHIEQQLHSGQFPELSELYLKPEVNSDGGDIRTTLKTVGDMVQQPRLAETLRNISVTGSDYLYVQQASNLASEIQAAGGIITKDDIMEYQSLFREPLTTTLFGYNYYGAPPPSSGGAAVATVLLFLAGYADPVVSMGGVYYHRLAEALKHAFALRMSLGDPDFTASSTIPALMAMLNNTYIAELRNITSDDHCLPELSEYGGVFSGFVQLDSAGDNSMINSTDNDSTAYVRKRLWSVPEDHGTSHVSVVDKVDNDNIIN